MPERAVPPSVPAVTLAVAGVGLEFRAAAGLRLAAPRFHYPAFLAAGATPRRVRVRVGAGDGPLARGGRLLFDTGDGWRLLGDGDARILEMPRRAQRAEPLWQVRWVSPLAEAEAWVAPDLVRDGVVHDFVQYPLDQLLLCEALRADGALLLHAAGARTTAGGIAFAGRSGAGKSTLCRLLRGIPGYRFLSDDRVFVRPERSGASMHGTPWSGDAHAADAASAPLAALCFLRHAPKSALRELTPREALRRLLPVTTLPWFDAAALDGALADCVRLVSETTCFELRFDRDPEALDRVVTGWLHAA